ncbi:helix-turn-helix domain-containing protein [Streptomyces asoensis]|uniref:AraC-like ligand-binding domain-containing protein n=1 Tax=Streptomyces asoensis TaxID=249586 RepID=UPI0037A19F72
MIGTVFRSEDVPSPDRFDFWREILGRTRSSDMASAHAGDFWAELRVMELGPVTVTPLSFLPTRFRRGPRTAHAGDPGVYHLSLLLDGGLTLEHAGREATFGPGDVHLADSARPYDLRSAVPAEGGVVRGVGVDFPRALLPLPSRRVREVLGRGLPGREGLGALLTDYLLGLDRQADTLRPCDAPRLGTVVLDLVSALFAQALDDEGVLPQESRRRVTGAAVRDFIRRNLHDPELTPPAIAAAHHISLSYLHRVFQEQAPGESGETVAAWIRARRMEAARRDLADPALRATPIHVIGARWGFPRASDFTRAYRAHHGAPPGEHRPGTPPRR